MAVDEKTLGGFRVAKWRAEALRSSGQHDDGYIVDSLMKMPQLSQSAKDILKQAKVQGVSTKAIDDILALPVEQKLEIAPVSSQDVRNSLERTLGKTAGGALASTSEFLGIDKIGRAIGSYLGSGELVKLKNEGKITQEQLTNFQQGGSTKRELLGSAAMTLGSVVAPGLAGTATKALGAIKGGAAVGAGFGAAGALEGGARTLSEVAGGAVGGAALGGAIPAAGRVLKYAAGRLDSKALSILTGEGTDVVESALKNPRAADAAIANGDEALRTVVQKGATQTVAIRDTFNKAYRTGMEEIGKQAQAVTGKATLTDKKVVQDTFKKVLESAKVAVKGNKLDFSQSQIQANPGEMAKVQQAYDAIKTWKDWSFAGTEDFKHLVGKLTKFADDAGTPSKSPTLGRAYNALNNVIKDSLPENLAKEYASANSKYSKTIDLYDEMVDAFNKGDPFSRVANLFSKNKDSLRQIVDFYDEKTGEGVAATVAGRELSAEKQAAFGLLNPRSWIDLLFSPKLQATGITALGKGQEAVRNSTTARTLGQGVGSITPRILGGAAGQVGAGNY